MLILEDRSGVVVEAANQTRIELEGNLFCSQGLFDDAKRLGAGCAQMVDDTRRIALQRLVLRILRIEEPERVALEPGPALLAQPGQVRPIVVAQQLAVRRPADLIANAVEVKRHAGNLEPGKPVPPQHDGFDVEEGARIADGFDSKLMEFVEPPSLRPFGTEVGAQVVEPHRLRLELHAGIEVGAHDGGGSLRSQCERTATAIAEGKHLLAHDVGRFAHATDEEVGRFEDRRLDALVAKPFCHVLCSSLQRRPIRLVRGQQVLRAARTLRDRRHGDEA